MTKLNLASKTKLFPVLSFLLPLVLRVIPEVLMSPYLVGFDPMGYYTPAIISWLNGTANPWNYITAAPMFYAITIPLVSLGVPITAVLKVLPPLLHGFLGLSMYFYAKNGLSWSNVKSATAALLSTTYFVAMRISWDLLRNELALVFFFVVLTMLSNNQEKPRGVKHYLLLSLAMLCVALTHQLVSVIMLGVVAMTVAHKLLKKDHKTATYMFLSSLSAGIFTVFVFFTITEGMPIIDFSSSTAWPLSPFQSYSNMLISTSGFFLYCFIPIMPLVILGLRNNRNLQLKSWIILSFALVLVPISILSNFRWVLMLTYPLTLATVDALSKLKSYSWKHWGLTLRRFALIYLVASTALVTLPFVFVAPETSTSSYTKLGGLNDYINQIPSSMLQNTVSISDCQDTAKAIRWFEENTNKEALLLTHRAFYGWALLELDSQRIVFYDFGNATQAANSTVQEFGVGKQIYLIWWINGKGWYGRPNVASSFSEVYSTGDIAIYIFDSATTANN